jgi:hypothetical protein
VAEGLTGGLGADDALAGEAQVQEEGRDQWAGGTDREVEHAHHPAECDESPVAVGAFGVGAEEEQARRPGGDQHEHPDQCPRDCGRQRLQHEQAHEARGQQQHGVAACDVPRDVSPLDPRARGVGDELDHTV